ncbi:MAG TPA: ABC transporter ATP-binding protein [Deltaproteobacteria bacterium]|nr:ABC transporter ATP-binding protein [Deltaproteobacteria bacterium]
MGIVLDKITKIYDGNTCINGISLEINDGEFVTLLGPTGTGKTTLLRIMAGIERPDKGRVFYNGVDVTDVPVQKRDVAMVYQQFINYPSLTIYENIASPLRVSRNKRFSKAEIDMRVRANAELLGITQVLNHYPEEVSGGQRQRTAIARALTKDAQFIFLDEPLANLDYKLREELRGELKKIFRGKGGAIVYATPEPVDALSMATHVGVMQTGNLLQYGPVLDVYHNPKLVDVGAYFSHPTMNMLKSVLRDDGNRSMLIVSDEVKIDVTGLRDRLAESGKVYLLGVHAYAISLHPTHERMIPIRATVELSEVVGSDTELHLDYQGIKLIILLQQLVTIEIGGIVEVFLDPDRFYIFDQSTQRLVAKTGQS